MTIEEIKEKALRNIFKRGDTVIITGNTNHSVNRVGDIGVVEDLGKRSAIRIGGEIINYYYSSVKVEGRHNRDNYTRHYEMEHYPQKPVKIKLRKKIKL